ncbi:MAG: serine--tRNA ligase, partial [Ignavibacteriae bacterium]|nr:serine--tRNA ligase [Ignavibacteriota bacterium]
MIDIKLIRENPELVKQGIANKNDKSSVDDILAVDLERREKLQLVEDLKSKRNNASQE